MSKVNKKLSRGNLFNEFVLGPYHLKNRMIMAPMTRSRASSDGIPSPLAVKYYSQRSNAGLIITEGTAPSKNGQGYPRVPGIYNEAQVCAWRDITKAVHAAGGRIFLQLMHVGRIAHALNKQFDAETVAPSAIAAAGQMYTDTAGMKDFPVPRALETDEIADVVEEYRQAAINAFEAGFDGVELHAASGYLPMQFLSDNSNKRTDRYGGNATNRIRFVQEVLNAMISVKGAEYVGIRIWPEAEFNDMHDSNPIETYTALVKAISPLGLAYLHVVRSTEPQIDALALAREHYHGVVIANGGFDDESGEEAIKSGVADLISYGVLYLSNPDLKQRFEQGSPLNNVDASTFYTPGGKGYIDYPSL